MTSPSDSAGMAGAGGTGAVWAHAAAVRTNTQMDFMSFTEESRSLQFITGFGGLSGDRSPTCLGERSSPGQGCPEDSAPHRAAAKIALLTRIARVSPLDLRPPTPFFQIPRRLRLTRVADLYFIG